MDDHGRGGIALGDVRWHRPLYAGTEVRSIVHIEKVRVTSRGKGAATMRFHVVDQDDELLMEFATTGLFARLADEADLLAVER
jgi:acyl dehydratase